MIEANIDAEKVLSKLKQLTPKIKSKMKALIGVSVRDWQSHVRSEYFTSYAYGKKSPKLQTRTGFLRGSVQLVPLKETKTTIESGINFGAGYAPVHVGPKGQTTTIKPKNKKFLTIPLESAMTARGEVRGRAMDSKVWGETFVAKTDKGNLIIFGSRKYQKGAKAGQTTGDIVPLFLLKKEVKIDTRIHPESIIKRGKEKFIKDMEQQFKEL